MRVGCGQVRVVRSVCVCVTWVCRYVDMCMQERVPPSAPVISRRVAPHSTPFAWQQSGSERGGPGCVGGEVWLLQRHGVRQRSLLPPVEHHSAATAPSRRQRSSTLTICSPRPCSCDATATVASGGATLMVLWQLVTSRNNRHTPPTIAAQHRARPVTTPRTRPHPLPHSYSLPVSNRRHLLPPATLPEKPPPLFSPTGFLWSPTGFLCSPTGFLCAPTGFLCAPTDATRDGEERPLPRKIKIKNHGRITTRLQGKVRYGSR